MDPRLTIALQRFDLRRFCEENGGQKAGRKEYLLICPHCGREKLSVSIPRRRWRCFICQRREPGGRTSGAGGILSLVQWIGGLDFPGAAQWVIAHSDPQSSPGEFLPEVSGSPEVIPEYDPRPRNPTGLPPRCIAISGKLPYMERRGISLDDAVAFGLGYVPEGAGWLQNRIVFPVWSGGQCLYWQARACWDESEHVPRPWVRRDGTVDPDKFRKSLNPAAERAGVRYFGSGDVLLNLEQASRYPRVAITEGPTSCIRAGPSAVATFGKTLSPQQIALLIGHRVRAVDFMWDGPKSKEPFGAWDRMITSAAQLQPHMDVRLVFLPRGDPGDWRREELDLMRAHARPLADGSPPL